MRRSSHLRLLVIVGALLASCTAADVSGVTSTPTDTATIGADRMGPLAGLPACPDPLPPATDEAHPAVPLPDATVVTRVTSQGQLVNLEGFIPNTPVQTRSFYENVRGATVLQSEDEGREAEILLSVNQQRVFVKASAACDLGSTFIAVIAPDDAAGTLPTPAGTLPDE